uniref:Uncharacterized protein n=1 Tax=Neisseria meningitidis alpha275 TaxID=295996 RepID=C6SI34_NEIME|nr:hypothetical protein predicted by Glimmer/Critica [Neisseria meningitidis alpha275]
MGFSPPKQRQVATTVKQRQARRWAKPTLRWTATDPHSTEANLKQPAHFQAAQSEHQTV